MLVFELDKENEVLEIHGNPESITSFAEKLLKLVKGNDDHIHLMTPSWSGEELSEELMDEKDELINHVKIFCWRKNVKKNLNAG